MERNCTHVKLEETQERVKNLSSKLCQVPNPISTLTSCATLSNTLVFSEFSSQAAHLGTLPIHLQVQRGQHRLKRLVYTDPQEMLSPHSPSTAVRAALLPLTALMCLCGIREKQRFRKDINLSSAI